MESLYTTISRVIILSLLLSTYPALSRNTTVSTEGTSRNLDDLTSQELTNVTTHSTAASGPEATEKTKTNATTISLPAETSDGVEHNTNSQTAKSTAAEATTSILSTKSPGVETPKDSLTTVTTSASVEATTYVGPDKTIPDDERTTGTDSGQQTMSMSSGSVNEATTVSAVTTSVTTSVTTQATTPEPANTNHSIILLDNITTITFDEILFKNTIKGAIMRSGTNLVAQNNVAVMKHVRVEDMLVEKPDFYAAQPNLVSNESPPNGPSAASNVTVEIKKKVYHANLLGRQIYSVEFIVTEDGKEKDGIKTDEILRKDVTAISQGMETNVSVVSNVISTVYSVVEVYGIKQSDFDEIKKDAFINKVAAILNDWPETKDLGEPFPLSFTDYQVQIPSTHEKDKDSSTTKVDFYAFTNKGNVLSKDILESAIAENLTDLAEAIGANKVLIITKSEGLELWAMIAIPAVCVVILIIICVVGLRKAGKNSRNQRGGKKKGSRQESTATSGTGSYQPV